MNKNIVSTRLKDVLNVDSINSTQVDFLATHVPFRKITVTNDLTGIPTSEYISEEEIYDRYFNSNDMYNRHQLIVVDGSSGSGKSHFIRWISAKLEAQDEQKDVVLMIRRSDNTLKGTIKQFLEIDEVKNIKNKDIYERLVRANQNVSEKRFKYEIYHKFIVEVEDDEKSILSRSSSNNLKELLSSSEFQERMLMAGGPIERIYSKIVDNDTENNEDTLALFDEDDFTTNFDFNTKLKNNASKRAVKMANKLLPESDGSFEDDECNPKVITKYMNSKVENVIRSCAGIEPGDFQQIFKEIRQELFKQGKNLVLLVEDITSCTGINQDLLNALIVEHTGSNEADKMCRLVSVIGTTTEYFKEFRDNYIDRITTKITIQDGAIGNHPDDLIEFVAKYLNAMSISERDIDAWYRNGALEEEYPVYDDPEESKWEHYNFNGKELSLYPFTKRAIINLYDGLNQHKTPRYILRKIIEPAVDNILEDKNHFPKFLRLKSTELNFDVEARIKSILFNIQINDSERDDYRDRVFALIQFWGDGTLSINKHNYIGGISPSIFNEFKLEQFAEKILGKSIKNIQITEPVEIPDTLPIEPPKIEKPKINKAFNDFAKILSDWHYEKKDFIKAYQVRDEIQNFIYASVEWQREGVSLLSMQMAKNSSYKLISIERQDQGIDKGLVLLNDNDETYELLLAFGKWYHIGKKSWNFKDSASSIRVATTWLEKNKSKFINAVKGYGENENTPQYIRCAIIAEIYRGIINGDYTINKLHDLTPELLLKGPEDRIKINGIGHSQSWIELQNNILYADSHEEKNIETIQKYYNLIQGHTTNSAKKIIKYTDLRDTFKLLKSKEFNINIEELTNEKIKDRNISKEYLKKILSRVEKVVNEECAEQRKCYKEVALFLGYSEDDEIEVEDIKDLLNEIIEFYKDVETNRINILSKLKIAQNMKDKSKNIVNSLSTFNSDISDKSVLEKLIVYSKNSMNTVNEFIKLLKEVDEDSKRVYLELKREKDELTRSGNWSSNVDPRFDSEKSSFDELIRLMEG